jgi:hypothetical protein
VALKDQHECTEQYHGNEDDQPIRPVEPDLGLSLHRDAVDHDDDAPGFSVTGAHQSLDVETIASAACACRMTAAQDLALACFVITYR